MPVPYWRCGCGEQFPEPGDGSGLRRARGHVMRGAGLSAGHRVEGLFDEDGNLLVKGPSVRLAQELGYVRSWEAGREEAADEERVRGRTGRSPIQAAIPYCRLTLPLSVVGYFALFRARLPHRYEPTEEAMARWVSDTIEAFARLCMRSLLGLDPDVPEERERGEAILRSMSLALNEPDRAQELLARDGAELAPVSAPRGEGVEERLSALEVRVGRIEDKLEARLGRIEELLEEAMSRA